MFNVAPEWALTNAFCIVQQAALSGVRCPTNKDFPYGACVLPQLARQGRVRVEVYARNFRRVEILVGDCKGMKTAAPQGGGAPYLVIDASGRHASYNNNAKCRRVVDGCRPA